MISSLCSIRSRTSKQRRKRSAGDHVAGSAEPKPPPHEPARSVRSAGR
jgi:hypothetical protein